MYSYAPSIQKKFSRSPLADRGVRVHDNAAAHQTSKELNAKAFTVGNDIYFGKNQFHPETKEGQGLIAHELTHVMQQKHLAQPMIQKQAADGPALTSPRFQGDRRLELCFDGLVEFQRGSAGESVRSIQQALIDIGYDLSEFGADNFFGEETERAVRAFQADVGFNDDEVDGIVGENTLSRLDSRLSEGSAVIPESACELGVRTIPVDVVLFDGFSESAQDYINYCNSVFQDCCIQLEINRSISINEAETLQYLNGDRDLEPGRNCSERSPDDNGLAQLIQDKGLSNPIKIFFADTIHDVNIDESSPTRLRGFAVSEKCATQGKGNLGVLGVANTAGLRTLPHELAHYLMNTFADHRVTEDNIQHITRGATDDDNITSVQCDIMYTRALEESL